MRLNQFLAAAGLGSRRACDSIIEEGRVQINGRKVQHLATRVGPNDVVTCDHRVVRKAGPVAWVMNKPRGVVCSTVAEGGHRPVFDLLPAMSERLFYAGRLDADSEGLLLFTNDGDLVQKLTHPRHHVAKVYHAVLDRYLEPDDLGALLKGARVEGKLGRFERVHRLKGTQVEITLRQGLKRQIRVMLGQRGYEVKRLVRVQFGPLELGRLRPGECRRLSDRDLDALRRSAAAPAPAPRKPARPAVRPPRPPAEG